MTSDTRTGNATRTQFFPSCSSSQAGFCSDSGSQSYKKKTTRTYLTFSPKSIQFLSGMSVMPLSLGKPLLSPPRRSVSSRLVQHHLSLRSRFSCSSASAFCPDRPQMTAGWIRQTLSTSLQNRLLRAQSTSVVHITECGLMTRGLFTLKLN